MGWGVPIRRRTNIDGLIGPSQDVTERLRLPTAPHTWTQIGNALIGGGGVRYDPLDAAQTHLYRMWAVRYIADGAMAAGDYQVELVTPDADQINIINFQLEGSLVWNNTSPIAAGLPWISILNVPLPFCDPAEIMLRIININAAGRTISTDIMGIGQYQQV